MMQGAIGGGGHLKSHPHIANVLISDLKTCQYSN